MDQISDASRFKTPAGALFWVVAVVSLLWNLIGVTDYTMTKLHNAAYLKGVDPDLLARLAAAPAWSTAAWALGVWGSLAGSLLLLARSRHAVTAFWVSLAGLALNTVYQRIAGYPFSLGLTLTIWLVLIALLLYARRCRRAGVLS